LFPVNLISLFMFEMFLLVSCSEHSLVFCCHSFVFVNIFDIPKNYVPIWFSLHLVCLLCWYSTQKWKPLFRQLVNFVKKTNKANAYSWAYLVLVWPVKVECSYLLHTVSLWINR
jgi:hypothetical protein